MKAMEVCKALGSRAGEAAEPRLPEDKGSGRKWA